jgi:hypothetical protein
MQINALCESFTNLSVGASAQYILNKYIETDLGALNKELQENPQYVYETFGKSFETYIVNKIKLFCDANYPNVVLTGSKTKNEFPDFTLSCDDWNGERVAVDVKCGSHHIKRGNGEWKLVHRSNNDLGTLNSIDGKLQAFTEILFLFVEYSITPSERIVHRITCKPFYSYIGRTVDNLISYREKDGNMRPSKFIEFDRPWITDIVMFKRLLEDTNTKRNIAITCKKFELLNSYQQHELLTRLCKITGMKLVATATDSV